MICSDIREIPKKAACPWDRLLSESSVNAVITFMR